MVQLNLTVSVEWVVRQSRTAHYVKDFPSPLLLLG